MKNKFMSFLEKLSRDEMRKVTGGYGDGTSLEEYCATNRSIRSYCCSINDQVCINNADAAWNQHCA
ncbi:hypothetical protein PZB74_12420 [Porifericola rhodea]|uniref:hypothetical protein n=1 Tax=Porifericola rhodea TaxID=930972 RepID=UPI002664FEEB|nr:hypothetical protein [Porifericola rhodea]WKN29771.1 hypothetical protein PZB74_12420 [Porifericola rhodea]